MVLGNISQKKVVGKEVSYDPLSVNAEPKKPPSETPKKLFKIIKPKLPFKIKRVKRKKKTLRLNPESKRTRGRPKR